MLFFTNNLSRLIIGLVLSTVFVSSAFAVPQYFTFEGNIRSLTPGGADSASLGVQVGDPVVYRVLLDTDRLGELEGPDGDTQPYGQIYTKLLSGSLLHPNVTEPERDLSATSIRYFGLYDSGTNTNPDVEGNGHLTTQIINPDSSEVHIAHVWGMADVRTMQVGATATMYERLSMLDGTTPRFQADVTLTKIETELLAPVTVDPGAYNGYYRLGDSEWLRGSKIVELNEGTYPLYIGVAGLTYITVDDAGEVSSTHPSIIINDGIVSFNTVTASFNPDLYLGGYTLYRAKIGWMYGADTAELIPGFNYRLYVGVADFVDVELDQTGSWVTGHAAFTPLGSELSFNTLPISVDASTYTGSWSLYRAGAAVQGDAVLDLPVDLRFRLVVAGFGGHDFDVLADGTVSLLHNVTLESGLQWLRFKTETVTVDPGRFENSYSVMYAAGENYGNVLTADLVPGVQYRINITNTDSFAVNLRESGIWEIVEGESADANGNVLILRNEDIYITPDNLDSYKFHYGPAGLSGEEAIVLVPDIKYVVKNYLGEEQNFELLAPCIPSPDTVNFTNVSLFFECGIPVQDLDGDGILDDVDNCPATPNADQLDFDNDGMGNACDSDLDGDGIENSADNCEFDSNPNQSDLDGDAIGDICDDDIDGDVISDEIDNCPLVANTSQADLDLDGLGDACDSDLDGDLLDNDVDNCPNHANSDQADTDGDTIGDLCDEDQDGDGVANASDLCPVTELGANVNVSGCSGSEWVDLQCEESAFKNHGQFIRCVAHAAEELLAEGVINEYQKDVLVSSHAKKKK